MSVMPSQVANYTHLTELISSIDDSCDFDAGW